MVNKRRFQLSCNIFWGFSRIIDLDEIEDKEDIVHIVKDELYEYLNKENLKDMTDKLDNMNFYLSETMEEITTSDEKKIFYLYN